MRVSLSMKVRLLCPILLLLLIAEVFSLDCGDLRPSFVRRLFSRLRPDAPANSTLLPDTVPSDCHALCDKDANCAAYFVDYRNHSCRLVEGGDHLDDHLEPDEEGSFHRKACLPKSDCDHEWAFDEVAGVQLEHYLDKTVSGVASSEACMKLCATEPTFTCRSARFDRTAGRCVLSQHDRRSASEVFRQSPDDVLYLERQCVKEPQGCIFRSRQQRSHLRQHRHVQWVSSATSREACEAACLASAPFACRSYQFGKGGRCLLSPEDSLSELGALKRYGKIEEALGETYYEKESCVDVDIRCGPSSMSVVVRVSTPFRGRLYAAAHPYDCYSVSVADDGRITLAMPLHGRQCGTKNLGNGTFMNSVIVQHHPFVLRTTDRRIDVACDYEEMKLKIRGSKGVQQGELKPLAHTVTAVAPTPPVRLRVVNATDQDVTGVELGDPLFLKVELADESVYGIFGSDLVAMASTGSETVLLINEEGCPVEQSVIQAFDRLPGSKSLIAPFQAFKFASDAAVRFQMTVSYCLDTCPPVSCDSGTPSNAQSFGRRRRRRRSTGVGDVLPGDVVTDVTMESPAFLVTNLLDSEQRHRWEQQFLPQEQGSVRVQAPSEGLCVPLSTLYVVGAVVASAQLAIVLVCALLFFRRPSSDPLRSSSSSSKSWPSVSSRRKLVCNSS